MPAVSKAQQKFMGMVHAAQKGEEPASPEVAKVAKSIGKKDAKDFASTKHKGLPSHVKESEEFPDEQPNDDDLQAALPSAAIPGVSAESVLPKRTNEILWTATGKVCEGRPFVERVRMYEKKGGGWRMGKQRDEQVYNNLKEFYTNEIKPRKEAKELIVKRKMAEDQGTKPKEPGALEKFVVTATAKGSSDNAKRMTITKPAPQATAKGQADKMRDLNKYQTVRIKKVGDGK